jgi:hypothetical protein
MEKDQLAEKITIVKKQIEASSGVGKMNDWRYSQFRALSDEISKVSGIRISHTTLIRIFKNDELQNIPQLSTLKALALYLGYQSWEDFLQKTNKRDQIEKEKILPKKKLQAFWPYFLGMLIICFLFIMFYFANKPIYEDTIYLELISKNPAFPQVLSFSYKVPDKGYYFSLIPKSFLPYIKLHEQKDVLLSEKDTLVNYKVTMPEHFLAIITKNDEVVFQKEISFKTEGWLGILQSKERKSRNHSRYNNIAFKPSFTESTLLMPNRFFEHIEENLLDRYFETNFIYINEFEIDANELVFETKFQNIGNPSFITGQLNRLTLITTNGLIEIPIVNENNIQQAKIWFSDHKVGYEKSSMQQYVIRDLSNRWINLRIEVANFEGFIYIDGKRVDTVKYNRPLGELTGIRYKFIENGKVDYCSIKNLDGDTLFFDPFKPEITNISVNK